jgi:mannose-1-phosphate guanylyltransferase/mannose-6-phosphate isomerase
MDISVIKPIILCGGSGTRLWPLSRESFPKQFVPLIDGKSLLQTTLERIHSFSNVLCVSNQEHRFFVQEAMQLANVTGEQFLEPEGRNTAAAMACAALLSGSDELLLFLPADHYIPDTAAFVATVYAGIDAAKQGKIVTFGVQPVYPSTAYGYIQKGHLLSSTSIYAVKRFIEKPRYDVAKGLVLDGEHFWNAGIFLIQASTLIENLDQYAPDILKSSREAVAGSKRDGAFIRPDPLAFLACRSDSIDYAVMEHSTNVAVVPFSGAWSDVGSWSAVAELTASDENGNRSTGQVLLLESERTYVNASSRPVVAIGTKDLLVIDTPDALLVVNQEKSELVKQAVTHLKQLGWSQAITHRRVARPWGWYDSIDTGDRFQVKRIGVLPGASLSMQMHHHRAEHWVVVKGTAEVTNGDSVRLVAENESTFIPLGTKHRLHNPGKTILEIIEVQSGSYLGEDDIVRFDDAYGRVERQK